MKRILIILGLFASVTTFAQSPRIKLNQITKDTVKGSVLISSPSDSGMVYSRDFYVAYGADTVLILYGDTLAATSGIISSVLSDGVTITGDGTSGNELKVDTATVISTIQGLVDSLSNYVTLSGTETISGAKTFTSDLNVDAKIALNAGDDNIVIGDGAGASLVSGQALGNLLVGKGAGAAINSGDYNVATGYEALYSATTASNNTANGFQALYSTTTGSDNVANGYYALRSNLSGDRNLANGWVALYNLNSGSDNQGYGFQAGRYLFDGTTALTTANGSLFLGNNTRASANGNSNEIVIGTDAIGNGSNSVTIGNDGTIGTATSKTILNGNIGIGTTTNNGAKVVFKGANAIPATTGTTTTAILRLSSGTGLYNVLDFGTNEAEDYSWIQSTRANSLAIYDRLLIQPNGGAVRIGGTAATSYKLLVDGTLGVTGAATFSSNVTANGNVGIGTSSPQAILHVSNGGAEGIEFGSGYVPGANLFQNYNRATSQFVKEVHYASEYQFWTGNVGIETTSPSYKLHVNGSVAGVGAYNNLSDVNYKKNINDLELGLDIVKQLRPITYNWINEEYGTRTNIGFIAQEVESVLPNIVTTADDNVKSMATTDLIPILTKAIQEQQAQIETLKTELDAKSLIIETQEQKITDLETTIQSLITRIENLENK